MSTMIAGTDKLNEIDANIRRAWQEYHEYLHGSLPDRSTPMRSEAWELLPGMSSRTLSTAGRS